MMSTPGKKTIAFWCQDDHLDELLEAAELWMAANKYTYLKGLPEVNYAEVEATEDEITELIAGSEIVDPEFATFEAAISEKRRESEDDSVVVVARETVAEEGEWLLVD